MKTKKVWISTLCLWVALMTLSDFAHSGKAIAQEKDSGDLGILNWQDNSATGLVYGGGFEVDPSDQSTITFEHASDWVFGDLFMFLDVNNFHNGDASADGGTYYMEISPRFSFEKITGKDIKFSIFGQDIIVFEDILLAMTYERGEVLKQTESILIGGGFDFDLSALGFIGLDKLRYFQFNIYAVNDNHSGNGFDDYQITVVTAVPITIGKYRFLIDGFMDWRAGEGDQSSHLHFVPQIKMDLGHLWNYSEHLYVGVEIDYWRNKFGIKDTPGFDTNQVAVSGLIKYHF